MLDLAAGDLSFYAEPAMSAGKAATRKKRAHVPSFAPRTLVVSKISRRAHDRSNVCIWRITIHVDATNSDAVFPFTRPQQPDYVFVHFFCSTLQDSHRAQSQVQKGIGQLSAAFGHIRSPAHIEKTRIEP